MPAGDRRSAWEAAGTIVKQARDAWVEVGGTRSGSWLIAMGVEAGRMLADELPPPSRRGPAYSGHCAQGLPGGSVSAASCTAGTAQNRSSKHDTRSDGRRICTRCWRANSQGRVPLLSRSGFLAYEGGHLSYVAVKELRRYGARVRYEGRWSIARLLATLRQCARIATTSGCPPWRMM